MTLILYLILFTVPMGAQFLNFSVGSVQMSPFRALLILELLLLFFKKRVVRFPGKNSMCYAIRFMFVWFTYSIISMIWTKDLQSWFKAVYFLFIGVMGIFVVYNIVQKKETLWNCFFSLNLGIAIQSFIGWYEVFTRDYRFIVLNEQNSRIYLAGTSRIPIAMQGNPNNFATMMLFGICIALICTKTTKKEYGKILNYILAINYGVLLIMTTSRANIIGLLLFKLF